jgi:hypothetical protein
MKRPVSTRGKSHPGPAPVEFAGQWVAWNKAQTEIVAHGKEVAAVRAAAQAAGHPDAVLEKVRRPGTIFIGGT